MSIVILLSTPGGVVFFSFARAENLRRLSCEDSRVHSSVHDVHRLRYFRKNVWLFICPRRGRNYPLLAAAGGGLSLSLSLSLVVDVNARVPSHRHD